MTRLGYAVVELKAGTTTPATSTTAFDWDGGELFDTPEQAADEAARAQDTGEDYDYRVAEIRLIEVEADA